MLLTRIRTRFKIGCSRCCADLLGLVFFLRFLMTQYGCFDGSKLTIERAAVEVEGRLVVGISHVA